MQYVSLDAVDCSTPKEQRITCHRSCWMQWEKDILQQAARTNAKSPVQPKQLYSLQDNLQKQTPVVQ